MTVTFPTLWVLPRHCPHYITTPAGLPQPALPRHATYLDGSRFLAHPDMPLIFRHPSPHLERKKEEKKKRKRTPFTSILPAIYHLFFILFFGFCLSVFCFWFLFSSPLPTSPLSWLGGEEEEGRRTGERIGGGEGNGGRKTFCALFPLLAGVLLLLLTIVFLFPREWDRTWTSSGWWA